MKRLLLPDVLKGFAVFLIVPVHIMETFIDYPGREGLLGKVLLVLGGPAGVPVFMIIMGYFIAKNKKSFVQNSIRGVKVFLVGLLLNIGLNFHLLLKIKYADWPYNPLEYIFGVDILYFAGLSILFLSALKLIKKGKGLTAVLIAFTVLLLTAFINKNLMVTERNYILPFIGGNYSWAYFPLFPWLAYPLAGFAFYQFEKEIVSFLKEHKIITAIFLAAITVLVLWFSKWGVKIAIILPDYYHHTFLFSLWTFGIVILWSVLLRFIVSVFPSNFIVVSFQWLGKNITLFYIIQWLIIGNVATAIYQTQPINRYFFWFAGIFTATVFLTWLIGKTNIKPAR